jgi:hypothetical protein
MAEYRIETDSLGEVKVPIDKLWGAQTQRSLEHFSIGKDLIPHEMITAYAILKKAAANANHSGKRLDDELHKLIVQVCDEIQLKWSSRMSRPANNASLTRRNHPLDFLTCFHGANNIPMMLLNSTTMATKKSGRCQT